MSMLALYLSVFRKDQQVLTCFYRTYNALSLFILYGQGFWQQNLSMI